MRIDDELTDQLLIPYLQLRRQYLKYCYILTGDKQFWMEFAFMGQDLKADINKVIKPGYSIRDLIKELGTP